jgi:hypothetical protein
MSAHTVLSVLLVIMVVGLGIFIVVGAMALKK